jgi:hypothetical protein
MSGMGFDAGQTKAAVLAKIDEALMQVNDVVQAVKLVTGENDPPPKRKVPLPAGTGGLVQSGKTLRLSTGAVLAGGELDIEMMTNDSVGVPPPRGFLFAGHVFDVLPDPGVLIEGPVTVGIEFGTTNEAGFPIMVDPADLRLVRFDSFGYEFLNSQQVDLVHNVVSGWYQPDSPGSGTSQWGLFALVQVPAPSSTAPLMALGLALMGRRRRCR